MSEPAKWKYDIDTGTVMARCPGCGGRMGLGIFTYQNPYFFCPYCGQKNQEKRDDVRNIQMRARYGTGRDETDVDEKED